MADFRKLNQRARLLKKACTILLADRLPPACPKCGSKEPAWKPNDKATREIARVAGWVIEGYGIRGAPSILCAACDLGFLVSIPGKRERYRTPVDLEIARLLGRR